MTQTTLAAPEDVVGAFADAWNRRDPDALAALFDEDAEFVNVTGLWWQDRPSIRKAHAYGLERIFNTSTLFATEVRVKRLSDAVAVVHARLKLAGQTPVAGVAQPKERTTVFTFVMHYESSRWSCAADHNTDVVSAAETNIIDDSGRFRSVSYRKR
jgi:uncharacterized protein (TIGR02246 family)